MTAATDMHCLSDETVAAYLDRALDEAARTSVIEHLGSCDECRSKVIEVRRTLELLKERSDAEPSDPGPGSAVDVEPEPPTPAPPSNAIRLGPKPKSHWRWTTAAVAASAVIAIVLLGPTRDWIFGTPGIPTVIEASNQLETRRTYGRLSGGFAYKEMMRIDRGPGDPPGAGDEELLNNLPLLEAQQKILKVTRPDPHASGVVTLLLGQETEAIQTLEALLATNPPNRDAVEQDLAVALLQRADEKNRDLEKSFEISDRLWATHKSPEIGWNRAYALQNMQRYDEAVAAWDEYLKRDPGSSWRKEALSHRAEMQEMVELLKRNP